MNMLAGRSSFFKTACVISLLALWASFAFSSALTEIASMTALAFWLLHRISKKDASLPADKKTFLLLVLFTGWCLLSLLWSEAIQNSFRGSLKVLQHAMIFLLVADGLKEQEGRKKWEILFIVLAAIIFLDGFFQYFAGKDLIRGFPYHMASSGRRVTASFKTYGLFACWLIMVVPLAAAVGLNYRKQGKKAHALLYALVFLAGLALLFLTRSRGAWLAFIAGNFALLIYKRQWVWLGVFIVGLGIGVSQLPASMIIHLDIHRKEQSLIERYHLWKRALDVIKARPVTGTGINTYSVAHQKYDTTKNWRVQNYYVHNGYLQMAAEIGAPGLLLFLTFLAHCILRIFSGLKSLPPDRQFITLGLLAGILNFLAFTAVDTVLHNAQPVMTFYFVLGLAYAYSRSSQNA